MGQDTVQMKDPVCGMTVGPESPHRFVHGGVKYAFCAGHCLEKFRQSPERYLKSVPEEERAAKMPLSAEGRAYTCPMHPEVVREGPGDCPRCGIDRKSVV
jgi:Cu+-exporting ATPase